MEIITIGVDPGPHTGIGVLGDGPGFALECDGASAFYIVRGLITAYRAQGMPVRVATEEFVIGPGSAKARQHGAITRRIVGELSTLGSADGVHVFTRRPVDVKAWASDKRLKAGGLWESIGPYAHARDGMRHALFSHVKDSGGHDPLLGDRK